MKKYEVYVKKGDHWSVLKTIEGQDVYIQSSGDSYFLYKDKKLAFAGSKDNVIVIEVS